jgi:hypothetical protein
VEFFGIICVDFLCFILDCLIFCSMFIALIFCTTHISLLPIALRKIRGSQIKQGKSDDGSESIENQTVTDKA